jgi:hypothetical protein
MNEPTLPCAESHQCPFPAVRALNQAITAAWQTGGASFLITPQDAGCLVSTADGAAVKECEVSFSDMRKEVDRKIRYPNHHQRFRRRLKYWLSPSKGIRGGTFCATIEETEICIRIMIRESQIECGFFTPREPTKETQNKKVDPIP